MTVKANGDALFVLKLQSVNKTWDDTLKPTLREFPTHATCVEQSKGQVVLLICTRQGIIETNMVGFGLKWRQKIT